jgi:hypothetical protein
MLRPATLFVRSLAIAALVGGIAMSPSLYAATSDNTPTMTHSPASAEAPPIRERHISSEDRVEERVKELHEKLKITPDQSAAWDNVAATMKQNEANVHALIQERHEKTGTQTAVEDLVSYQKIAAAHAEGLGKFVQAFQPLYDSMPEAQKKNADTVFGSYEGHDGGKGQSKSR